MRLLLFLLLLLPLSLWAQQQVYYSLGGHASFMAKTGPIETTGVFFGHHQGFGTEIGLSSKLPLLLGLQQHYSFQGYQQQKAGATYTYRMHYLQFPVYLSYPLLEGIRAEAGAYLAYLGRARFIHGSQRIGVRENYRNLDAGLLVGLNLLTEKRINIYLRYLSSLKPALVYPNMAPSGEFIGTLRLLRPQLIGAGIRFNFN